MKIIIYCQHVLGVGHFFRTLEIARNLECFDVILVTGGGRITVTLPSHVRHVNLPGLMMDEKFSGLHSVDPQKSVDEVKVEREKQLMEIIKAEKPDVFLIELYPFGRKAFQFELNPVLTYLKENKGVTQGVNCKVVCSLRDILVERQDSSKHEKRVVNALNNWFDAVLVHSDKQLIKLSATFSMLDKIQIPIVYTGFVTPVPDQKKVDLFMQQYKLTQKSRLIVASAGGGNVGAKLLRAVVHAVDLLSCKEDLQLNIYTGPYMDEEDKKVLHAFEGPKIQVREFTDDFVSLLNASDLSISMAGYNTCMNIVAAKVPSLVWPFSQNQEQRARAQKLVRFSEMTLLEDQDLSAFNLSRLIEKKLAGHEAAPPLKLNLDGAVNTMKWIKENH